MTTLANPNHMVIGQLIYDVLDDNQKSLFQQLDISSAIWNYANNNTDENIYNVYTNIIMKFIQSHKQNMRLKINRIYHLFSH